MKKTNENIYDKIENIILKSMKTIGLMALTLLGTAILPIILTILKIDYKNMKESTKIILSAISDIILLLIIMKIYAKTLKKDFKNYFNHNFKNNIKESISIWLIGFGIMITSNMLIALLTNGQISTNEEAVRNMINNYPLYMAFQLMVYAPITEELIFRKSIKEITNKKYPYIILSGLIFGGLHVITSLNTQLGFLYLIPYCTLGFAFAYLYHKTDNIFSTITVHSIHNTLALLLYLKGI